VEGVVSAKRILMVFSEQESGLRAEIEPRLAAGARGELRLDTAQTRWQALPMIEHERFDLVVVGAHLAASPLDPASDEGGLDLCKAIRQHSKVPIAFVAPLYTNHLQSALQRLDPPPTLFVNDHTVADEIAAKVAQIRPQVHRLDVVIHANEGTEWRYDLVGTGFRFNRSERLEIRKAMLTAWSAWARSEPADDWYQAFAEIGTSIIEAFCEANRSFHDDLQEGIRKAGGLSATRVTFVMERAHYHLALEAIFPPPSDIQEPWMIHAPIYRNVRRGGDTRSEELFADSGRPLRSLIICADASGFVDSIVNKRGRALELRRLESVGKECDLLAAAIRRQAQRQPFEEPVLLSSRNGSLTEHSLLTRLESKWDIVHFAGHSHYGRDEQGHVFLGTHGKPHPVNIGTLVPHLRDTKLVYFSSCRSGNASFTVEAAKRGVPAVIGYRWPVDDRNAKFHARAFYHYLFKHRSIDMAFWSTRRHMHRVRPEDNTWASSVLVMGRA
jgi:hypothetical protein